MVKSYQAKKKWLKLHVAVYVQTERVSTFSLTEAEVHNGKMVISLAEELNKRLQSLLSDKDHNPHRTLNGFKIFSGIMPRKSSKVRGLSQDVELNRFGGMRVDDGSSEGISGRECRESGRSFL